MPQSDEELVRESWEGVEIHDTGMTMAGDYYVSIDHFSAAPWRGYTASEAWAAAAAFTRERKRKISEREEEIAWVKYRHSQYYPEVSGRILAMLTESLAALKSGMKEPV